MRTVHAPLRQVRRGLLCVLGISTLLGVAPGALANFEPTIEKELEEQDQEREEGGHTHLGRGVFDIALEPYDVLRERAKASLGLDWFAAYSYLYQHRTHGGEDTWTNNSELDILFSWDLLQDETFGDGSLNGMFSRIWEHRNGATTSEVTESTGTAFPLSDSDKIETLRQFYWTQSMFDDRL